MARADGRVTRATGLQRAPRDRGRVAALGREQVVARQSAAAALLLLCGGATQSVIALHQLQLRRGNLRVQLSFLQTQGVIASGEIQAAATERRSRNGRRRTLQQRRPSRRLERGDRRSWANGNGRGRRGESRSGCLRCGSSRRARTIAVPVCRRVHWVWLPVLRRAGCRRAVIRQDRFRVGQGAELQPSRRRQRTIAISDGGRVCSGRGARTRGSGMHRLCVCALCWLCCTPSALRLVVCLLLLGRGWRAVTVAGPLTEVHTGHLAVAVHGHIGQHRGAGQGRGRGGARRGGRRRRHAGAECGGALQMTGKEQFG